MSWRELVNWHPESYTQIEHNTHNKLQEEDASNSAYCAQSTSKELISSKSLTKSEAQSNSAYCAHSASSLKKKDSQHTPEEEMQIQSFLDWVNTCQPGQEWRMPLDWLTDAKELREAAAEAVMRRHPQWRIWMSGKDKLICLESIN